MSNVTRMEMVESQIRSYSGRAHEFMPDIKVIPVDLALHVIHLYYGCDDTEDNEREGKQDESA